MQPGFLMGASSPLLDPLLGSRVRAVAHYGVSIGRYASADGIEIGCTV